MAPETSWRNGFRLTGGDSQQPRDERVPEEARELAGLWEAR
jgi:hypothetical protein